MRLFNKGWHVLYVQTRHEKKINSTLKEMEMESFLPTVTTLSQWKDRKKKINRPLFPSYVFININSKKEFNDALGINGVYKYLCFGEDYARVKNEEINRIKHFLGLEGICEIETSNRRLTIGEKMIINYGSLTGLPCEVVNINKRSKVFVRIESLRQNITAIVPSSFLSPDL